MKTAFVNCIWLAPTLFSLSVLLIVYHENFYATVCTLNITLFLHIYEMNVLRKWKDKKHISSHCESHFASLQWNYKTRQDLRYIFFTPPLISHLTNGYLNRRKFPHERWEILIFIGGKLNISITKRCPKTYHKGIIDWNHERNLS